MTGQQEVVWRKLIGAKRHSMLITKTLTLKDAQYQDLLIVPQTQGIGGKEVLTKLLMPWKPEDTGGFV